MIDAGAPTRRLSRPSRFAVRFIETYRRHVGPSLNVRCRFEPSCSTFALEAYRRHGFVKATRKTLGRLARCRKRALVNNIERA